VTTGLGALTNPIHLFLLIFEDSVDGSYCFIMLKFAIRQYIIDFYLFVHCRKSYIQYTKSKSGIKQFNTFYE